MFKKIRLLLNSKFNIDLLWNVAGFGISGIIGILINVLLYRFYDSSVLGVFNQIYAVYIMLSQLAVGGVQFAVQFYIPNTVEKGSKSMILISALFASAITSILVMVASYLFKELPGDIMQSDGVSQGFIYVIPGLLFFSFNKVLMAYLNGERRMKPFAVFQLLRFVFMLFALVVFKHLEFNPHNIAFILTIAEVLLFLILISYHLFVIRFKIQEGFWFWFKRNFNYGNKVLIGNVLMDVNTRVDIFLLGIFLKDTSVGIYSFAATVAEGVYQLPILFRNNINPVLTNCHSLNNKPIVERVVNRSMSTFYKLLSTISLISILLFPILLWISGIKDDFYPIWGIYSIMILGVFFTSGYIPFQMIFNQLGLPFQQTLFFTFSFVSNILLNLFLIPLLGVYGAAIATSIVMIVQVFLQKILVKKYYHIKIRGPVF